MEDKHEFQDFSLEDILNEFNDIPQTDAAAEDFSGELDGELDALLSMSDADAVDFKSDSAEAPADSDESSSFDASETEQPVSAETILMASLKDLHDNQEAAPEETTDATIRMDALENSASGDTIRMDSPKKPVSLEDTLVNFKKVQEAPRIVSTPRTRLRELKRKLVAGPEKRYYELSEENTGVLQISIGINLIIVALCILVTTLYALDFFPETRLRFVVFSQILAMLVSALLGCQQILDGIGDLFKGRFTINTLLGITFAACCADAVFCLSELRIPCCAAFSLELTMSMWAKYQRHSTEMAQMDTLRKAARLHGLVKVHDYYDKRPGFLRREGVLEDFMDNYNVPSGPEKLQGFYALLAFLLSIAIAALAFLNHGTSMAVQIFSTTLLVSIPASFFVATTRPAALLERRLHMVGTVLCGWKNIRQLCCKAVFPLSDEDLFPAGTTKLNGVKFYGERSSEDVIAYATSLIGEAGGSLEPVLRQMLESHDCQTYPVANFQSYGSGGIGGEIRNVSVLLGSLDFLQDMGVEIPKGTMVSQAVYVSIDGELSAVFAISYAKMRSSAAGITSLCGSRRVSPILTGSDFMLTPSLLRAKFNVNTRRILFPSSEIRETLAYILPEPEEPCLALTTRDDLAAYAYAVSGARALRTATRLGVAIHLFGGILGLLVMAALAYLGTTELLTPTHIVLYQLVWMVPGLLITEWTRTV